MTRRRRIHEGPPTCGAPRGLAGGEGGGARQAPWPPQLSPKGADIAVSYRAPGRRRCDARTLPRPGSVRATRQTVCYCNSAKRPERSHRPPEGYHASPAWPASLMGLPTSTRRTSIFRSPACCTRTAALLCSIRREPGGFKCAVP
jgi:hypothetical protein